MMTVDDGYRENTYKANAGEQADRCREKMERITACGFPVEIHPYLQSPMGYLVTAQRFGELDRLNSAQKAIQETEKQLKELILQLAD